MSTPPSDRHIVLHHAPQTRSFGTLALLLELDADHELHVLNMKAGEQRQPAYLAVNPMGKVPAISHLGALVTEQPAICIYLGDLYADRGLAPQIGDPLRGPYLRWLVFYGSCFEPALIDKAQKHAPAQPSSSPYGDFDTMLKTLTDQLDRGPFILGDRYSAADILWATGLGWTTMFGLVPATPSIAGYIARVKARPVFERVRLRDEELARSLAT